jgi:hypothetical protein
MLYSQDAELRSLIDVAELCNIELKELLSCDHPPVDYIEKISKTRETLADIEWLIADIKAKIATRKIYNDMKKEYTMVHAMNRLSV